MTSGPGARTLPGGYFDDLYAQADDPWQFAARWYEQRKRALTVAMLPDEHYASAYEPGCSVGILTHTLAGRCEALLATDISATAVARARQRCADQVHVRVEQAVLPADWPTQQFDLIVLSEIGYYFSIADLTVVAAHAMAGAATVLAVHWRHPVADYPQTGDDVHSALGRAAADVGKVRLAGYLDEDFVAEVWANDTRSVATREGLE